MLRQVLSILIVMGFSLLALPYLLKKKHVQEPKAVHEVGLFHLRTSDHKVFEKEQVLGDWRLVYFGFTNCPDICPATLGKLQNLRKRFIADGVFFPQVIFVSVDPDRDSGSRLADYVKYFPGVIGVTGPLGELKALTASLGANFEFRPRAEGAGYDVFHDTRVFLLSPAARVAKEYREPIDIEGLEKDLRGIPGKTRTMSGSILGGMRLQGMLVRRKGPLTDPLGVYGEIRNLTDKPIRLLSLTSPQFERVELHTMVKSGDMMGMQPLTDWTWKPGENLVLEEGGKHIMLTGRKATTTESEPWTIEVETDLGRITFSIPSPDTKQKSG